VNPFESEELAGLRAQRAKNERPLGEMPLVVLTRGISDETGPDAKSLEDDHQKEQAALAVLSRSGKQVIATHSGHHIRLDEPNLVIKSIGDVLQEVRE
jgi:hypothetical protein